MSALTPELREYIEENTLRLEASRRGGGIEIDASEQLGIDGAKMTAYQNYLGGGLLGSISNSYNAEILEAIEAGDIERDTVTDLGDSLARYFHEITNEDAADYDEWNDTEFDSLQNRPGSAY